MKILHTSDWHLGQHFFGKSRAAEHQAFLDWLLAQVEKEQVDAVIVAGDIFDTTTPPSYAREMYNSFVVKINQLGCKVIMLGGNHDSVAVLNEPAAFIELLDSYVVASTDMPFEKQLIPLKNRAGEVAALVCAVPFIRPRDILKSEAGESIGEKDKNLETAIQQHYHQLFQAANDYKNEHQLEVPIIMTGHLTALNVSLSESVREIYIGTLKGFDASGFPDADYIALGHIHRPQAVGGKAHIRYSGSPIPLSFDELGDAGKGFLGHKFFGHELADKKPNVQTSKQVVLVNFEKEKLTDITPLEVPLFQPMAVLSGDLDAIQAQLERFFPEALRSGSGTENPGAESSSAESPENPSTENPTYWLQVNVEKSTHIKDLQTRLQKIVQGYPVEVLRFSRAKTAEQTTLTHQAQETLEELSPTEVFEKRLENDTDVQAQVAEDTDLLARLRQEYAQVLEAVRAGETTQGGQA